MKQYERLGMDTEAALKWVKECAIRYCRDCPAYETQELRDVCAPKYLLSDVPKPPKVPRWQTAKTQEDFDRLYNSFKQFCAENECMSCKFCKCWKEGMRQTDCYHAYLSELVEVEVEE